MFPRGPHVEASLVNVPLGVKGRRPSGLRIGNPGKDERNPRGGMFAARPCSNRGSGLASFRARATLDSLRQERRPEANEAKSRSPFLRRRSASRPRSQGR